MQGHRLLALEGLLEKLKRIHRAKPQLEYRLILGTQVRLRFRDRLDLVDRFDVGVEVFAQASKQLLQGCCRPIPVESELLEYCLSLSDCDPDAALHKELSHLRRAETVAQRAATPALSRQLDQRGAALLDRVSKIHQHEWLQVGHPRDHGVERL